MTEPNAPRTCPVCNKEDSIQRLSAIVASGTSSGTFSGPSGGVTHTGGEVGTYGGYTTLSGTSMSNLARALAFPAEPKFPMVYPPLFFWILVIVSLVVGLVTLGVGLVLFFFTWVYIVSNYQVILGSYSEEYAKHGKRLAEWKLARAYWSGLYYCHRDGILFDPVSREHVQPDQTVPFAYRHIQPVPVEAFAGLWDRAKRVNSISGKIKAIQQAVDEYLSSLPAR